VTVNDFMVEFDTGLAVLLSNIGRLFILLLLLYVIN